MGLKLFPYARTTYDGHTVNRRGAAFLDTLADNLGYKDGMTVFQGMYNPGGVGASGGTHDGGGAVDLSPFDWEAKVRAARALGAAAWHRERLFDANGNLIWNEHIHMVIAGDRQMSPEARNQIEDYNNHLDGLAGMRHDDFPFHPDLTPVFSYADYVRKQRRRTRARLALTGAIKKLIQARANTDGVVRKRRLTRVIATLRKQRSELTGTH